MLFALVAALSVAKYPGLSYVPGCYSTDTCCEKLYSHGLHKRSAQSKVESSSIEIVSRRTIQFTCVDTSRTRKQYSRGGPWFMTVPEGFYIWKYKTWCKYTSRVECQKVQLVMRDGGAPTPNSLLENIEGTKRHAVGGISDYKQCTPPVRVAQEYVQAWVTSNDNRLFFIAPALSIHELGGRSITKEDRYMEFVETVRGHSYFACAVGDEFEDIKLHFTLVPKSSRVE